MGHSESTFRRSYEDSVSQLSSVQLREITTHFNEVYAKAGGSKGHLVDREAFSKYFKLPVTVGERLFEAFDAQKNGKISFEEFVCGLAVLLHGNFSSKCQLLFQVFNIHGDEGISREELATMLHAILQSTNTIVMAVSRVEGGAGRGGGAVMEGENREQAIRAMVDSAFRNCDITGTGKLLPLEFEYWVRRNPKILDTLLSFQPRGSRGTLGPLLITPDNDNGSETTVTVPLHPSPIPSSSSTSTFLARHTGSGSLEVTHTIRPIRSEPTLVATQTPTKLDYTTQSVSTEILSNTVTMKTTTAVTVSTGEATPTSPVAIEMGASSPTLVSEPDIILQSEMGTLFGVPSAEPKVEFITGSDEEEEGEGGEGEREVGEEAVDKRDGEVESKEGEGKEEDSVAEMVKQASVGDQGGEAGERDGGMGEGKQAGSIMQSQETLPVDMNLDLPPPPQLLLSYIPSSPLLPTTMETITLEVQEEEEEGEEEGEGEIEEPLPSPEDDNILMGVDLGVSKPLPISELPPVKSEETVLINIESSGVTFSGEHPLGQGEHQLEVTEHQPQDSDVYKLDVQESGAVPPTLSDPLSAVVSSSDPLSMGTVVTHLSDPVSSGSVPSLLATLSFPYEEGEQEDVAVELQSAGSKGDVGPDPTVLPPRRPSPFPEVVAGVKEALYTAWIPSPWTQGLLSRLSTITGQHLTCPGLVADIKMHDPISELLSTHFPGAPRKTLPSVESVSMDMTGLRRLVKEGCYHAALELTGRFLSAHGQGLGQAGQPSLHTHKTLQMWAARLSLLVAMQQYRETELEFTAFADLANPDLYYQYHTQNYPGKTGSMVPFSMRLLHAQLPSHTGNHQQALDRLCLLQHTCQEVLAEVRRGYLPFVSEPLAAEDQQVADSLWLERLTRVKFSLANTLVAMQDYLLAVQVYESLLEQLPGQRSQLLSLMGRLFLSLGDLPSAQSYFSQVSSPGGEGGEGGEGDGGEWETILTHINQGLVNMFLSRWQLARDSFESALQLDPGSLALRNNIAICTFYQGHLKECISELEDVVGSCPPSSLQPALFSNLTAAYDLESSCAHSKKLSFLPLLGQHVGEGFPLSALNVR